MTLNMFQTLLRVLFVSVCAASFSAAQSTPAAEPRTQQERKDDSAPAKATVLSGAALRFGADLENATPQAFLKWARNFAKKEILKPQVAPNREAVSKALNADYGKSPELSRKAGEILLWYLAYQEGTKNQEVAAVRVHDMEKELARLEEDQQQLDRTPAEFKGEAKRDTASRILGQIEQDRVQRDTYKRVLDLLSVRVDFCLQNLSALLDESKGLAPAEIRNLK